jgi:beta-glucosidase
MRRKVIMVNKGFVRKVRLLLLCALVGGCFFNVKSADYMDFTAPIDARVDDLVSKLTTMEKLKFRSRSNPVVTRLGIKNYYWWDEMEDGWTTIWPSGMAKSCSWDRDLCFKMGSIQGDEARINYKTGHQFYSPCDVNLAMDPRGGRNDESWGEDPFLCGELASYLVRGAQGNREYKMRGGSDYYLKVGTIAKHFVGNDHENDRFWDTSGMDMRDYHEYYLAPFEALVKADVCGVMTGLNKITVFEDPMQQGKWNYENPVLLDTILRKQWGFTGYVTTDCAANHNAPLTLACGVDGLCRDTSEMKNDPGELDSTAMNRAFLDRAVKRLLRVRFRGGEFDPDSVCPYRTIPSSKNNSAEAKALALRAAREVVVLAKNANNMLPLSKSAIKKIVLVGEMAEHPLNGGDNSAFGGYTRSARDENTVNVLDAVTALAAANGMTLIYAKGNAGSCINSLSFSFTAAEINAMIAADVIIGVVGAVARGSSQAIPCSGDLRYPGEGHDLPDLKLPGVQEAMLSRAYTYNHKLVTVLQDLEVRTVPFIFDTCPAVVVSLGGGQQLGQGIVDVLFGESNPSGKFSQTWIKNLVDYPGVKTAGIPDQKNYRIRTGQRTYMYYRGAVNFPFGYGLSYTTFAYSNISDVMKSFSDTVAVISFSVQNIGSRDGAEIAQLYVHALNPTPERPIKELRNFSRVDIPTGTTSTVSLAVTKRDLAYWSMSSNAFVADAGKYEILIGSSSQDIRLRDTITLSNTQIVAARPYRQLEENAAQSGLIIRSATAQRVFVDSRHTRFSGNAIDLYEVYACNGKRLTQRKGSEMNTYLDNAPNGIYIIKSKIRTSNP